jgi:sulfur relay (sulfurtransferase) DsrF/TusC family protein
MRVLQIIEPAHRATLEEQDDTVLWFTRALRAAGAAADVLFVGTAVSYAVRGQSARGLAIGAWSQSQPPSIEHEIDALLGSGAQVTAIVEDLDERGIGAEAMIPRIARLHRRALGELLAQYDRVWKW